jgi:hypothetical protein
VSWSVDGWNRQVQNIERVFGGPTGMEDSRIRADHNLEEFDEPIYLWGSKAREGKVK